MTHSMPSPTRSDTPISCSATFTMVPSRATMIVVVISTIIGNHGVRCGVVDGTGSSVAVIGWPWTGEGGWR